MYETVTIELCRRDNVLGENTSSNGVNKMMVYFVINLEFFFLPTISAFEALPTRYAATR